MNSKLLAIGVFAVLAVMVGIAATTNENTFAKNRVNGDNNTLSTIPGPCFDCGKGNNTITNPAPKTGIFPLHK